jgi:preprotein translocase subunit SecB
MTEEQANQPEQVFEIQRVYLKDASFESPGAPAVFTREFKPDVNVELNTGNKKLAEHVYEVLLNITVTVKVEDQVAYLVEIKQAGVFAAAGYSQEQLGHLLGSYCPNILYPFAREAISDLAVKGGYPQILLAPINFDALYQQHLQEQADAREKSEESTRH